MNKLLSIDIGKSNIHLVEGNYFKGILQIEKAMSISTPHESFTGEIINNPEILTENLMMAIKNTGFTAKDTIVTTDAVGAVIRDIVLPNAKPKEIIDMIKTEMIQTYHILPTDVVQYKIIDKSVNELGNQLINYRVAALDEEIIESYYNVLIESKLKPIAMDININTIAKLISNDITINDKKLDNNDLMLIDIGAAITTVYIFFQGKPMFYRHIDSGSGDIETIISNEVFTSIADIRNLKENGYNFFSDDEGSKKYFEILSPFLFSITDEIRKIIGFYSSRSNNSNIDQILLFGGGSNLVGFAEYFENIFGIPTEQVSNISHVKFKDSSTPVASYMNAIGALIRY